MSVKLILLILLVIAVVLLAITLFFQRRKRVFSKRSKYISALYALVDRDTERALKLLTDAIKEGETDASAYLLLGNLLRERGQADKAFQIHMAMNVRKDLRDGEREELTLAIAEDLLVMGKKERAIQYLESLSRKTRDEKTAENIHRLYHRAGEYDKAFDVLKELSKKSGGINKRTLSAYLSAVAGELLSKDNKEETKKYLEKALRTDSSCPSAIFLLGKMAMDEGDMRRASEFWQTLCKEDVNFFEDIRIYLERSLYESGNFDEFEKLLNELLQLYPGNSSVASALASFYNRKGEVSKAIEVLSEDFETLKRDKSASMILSSLYLDSNNISSAKQVLEDAINYGDKGFVYRCPNCNAESKYPMFYCTNCFSQERFDKYNV